MPPHANDLQPAISKTKRISVLILAALILFGFCAVYMLPKYFQPDDRWDRAYLFYAQTPHTDPTKPAPRLPYETPRRLASILVLSGNGSFYFVNVDKGGTFLDFQSGKEQGRFKVTPDWSDNSTGRITFNFHNDRSPWSNDSVNFPNGRPPKTYRYTYKGGPSVGEIALFSSTGTKYILVSRHIISLRNIPDHMKNKG